MLGWTSVTGFVSQPQVVAHGALRWLDFVRFGRSTLYRLAHENPSLLVCAYFISQTKVHSLCLCACCPFLVFFFLSSMCETLLKVPSGELVVLFVAPCLIRHLLLFFKLCISTRKCTFFRANGLFAFARYSINHSSFWQ